MKLRLEDQVRVFVKVYSNSCLGFKLYSYDSESDFNGWVQEDDQQLSSSYLDRNKERNLRQYVIRG